MAYDTITQESVKYLFDYENGNLYWKNPTSLKCNIGDVAGGIRAGGYCGIRINYKAYYTHRLVYLYHHGHMPDYIDHIDGNKLNNAIENLRECTNRQNLYNSKIPTHNTSGIKGVNWHKSSNKWMVRLSIDGKPKYIGQFEDLELAELVIIEARNKFYGEFARHV